MHDMDLENGVAAIVAEVAEPPAGEGTRTCGECAGLAELERRLSALEATVAGLGGVSAAAAPREEGTGRRTATPRGSHLLAKAAEAAAPGAIDAALCSLPLEQRIAVKAGLLRAGLL